MAHQEDEFFHQVMQATASQVQNLKFLSFGHLSDYDPQTGYCRAFINVHRDMSDMAMQTPWIPLGAPWVGNNFGMVYYPHCGATAQNPTQGEQVIIMTVEREAGIAAVANLFYTDLMTPPTQLPGQNGAATTAMVAGEAVMVHETGSYIRFRGALAAAGQSQSANSGNIEINCNQDLVITTTRDANVTAGRDALLTTTRDCIAVIGRDATVSTIRNASLTAGGSTTVTSTGPVLISGSATISITGNGAVNLTSTTTLNATAPIINVDSVDITLGLGPAFLTLVQSTFITAFNVHTHPTPSGLSGGPSTVIVPSAVCTANTYAS